MRHFGAPGSPVSSKTADLPRSWMIPSAVSADRISRTSPSGFQNTCRPSPCGRLSRPPSTTAAPSPCAARRAIPPSHGAGRLERDVGAPSAPLNGVIPHRPPRGRFRRRRLCRPIAVAPTSDAVSGDVRLHPWRLGFEQCGPHLIARALRNPAVSVFGPLPLRRHATVPLGFRRRVSRWPKGRLFQTPPFCERDPAPGEVARASRAGESHPHALPEPDVSLSTHPAPDVQPLDLNGFTPRPGLLPSLVGPGREAEQRSPFGPAPLQSFHPYYGLLRPCAPRRYSRPCGDRPLGLLLSHRSDRFPSSAHEPELRSRRLHAGCR